jgi:multisubunit Na+/H+ antiporter MnhE subunit
VRRRARLPVVEVAGWWLALTLLGLCFVGTVDRYESAVMLACGLLAAVLAVVARRAERGRYAFSLSWLRGLPGLPRAVLTDTGRLAVLVARSATTRGDAPAGRWVQVPLGTADGESDAHARTRRAVATTLASLSPGSYVGDVDEEGGILLVHELVGDGRSAVSPALLTGPGRR